MNAGVTACSLDTHEGDLAAVPIAMEVQGLAGYITTDGIIDVSCLVFSTASLVEVSIIAKSEWIDGCMQGLWPAALTCVRVAVSSAMKVPGSAGYITRGSIIDANLPAASSLYIGLTRHRAATTSNACFDCMQLCCMPLRAQVLSYFL